MSLVSASGSYAVVFDDGPEEDVVYELPRASVPVLNSFLFRFAGENNLNTVAVMPGGASEDLTPESSVPFERVPEDRVRVNFRDRDMGDLTKDPYRFAVRHAPFSYRDATRFQIRESRCVGSCRRNVLSLIPSLSLGTGAVPSPILALCGFRLAFPQGEDHEIGTVAVVLDENGDLEVALNDRQKNHPFKYVVDFARISSVGLNVKLGKSSGRDEFHQHGRVPMSGSSTFLLRGFRLAYVQPGDQGTMVDRKILQLGVMQVDDEVHVRFRDGDGLEEVEWTVSWGIIEAQSIQ